MHCVSVWDAKGHNWSGVGSRRQNCKNRSYFSHIIRHRKLFLLGLLADISVKLESRNSLTRSLFRDNMAPWATQFLPRDSTKTPLSGALCSKVSSIIFNNNFQEFIGEKKNIKHCVDSVGRQLMEKCLFKDEIGSLSQLVKCKCR